jgi:hypothetical protein
MTLCWGGGIRTLAADATVPKVIGFDTVGEGEMRQLAGFKLATDTAPNTENGTVVALPGREGTNQDQSRRQYLTEKEVTQLCDAARARGRWGYRDATMILAPTPRLAGQRACRIDVEPS